MVQDEDNDWVLFIGSDRCFDIVQCTEDSYLKIEMATVKPGNTFIYSGDSRVDFDCEKWVKQR